MFRLLANLLVNLLLAIRAGLRALLKPLKRNAPPVAVWLRVKGELPYLAEPKRAGWLVKLWSKQQHPKEAEPASLRELERDLEALAAERRVRALVVHLEEFEGSGASLSALARAVEPFRRANKPVWGYSRMATTGEYRFLAGLDRFLLGPGGRLELSGYQAEVFSLKDALAQFGVRPQFVRRGEFKTAPEMFTRDRISPAQEQTLSHILDARAGALVAAMAEGRKLSPAEAQAALDRGPYSARRAIEANLADGVADPHGIEAQLQDAQGKNLKVLPYGVVEGYHRVVKTKYRPLRKPDYAAVVPVKGLINLGEGRGGSGPRVAGCDSVVASIERAAEDERAKAILLYVDSGGGSAIASEVIHAAVSRAKEKKPVIAYFDKVAASGGYMACVGAKEIWCAPEAIAGSIGVFAGKFDVEGLLGMLKVGVDAVSRGANAGLHSPLRPWTPTELAALEGEVEETYRDFVRLVAQGRGLSEEAVHASGEGRVFTGAAALERKLVDGLCDFRAAVGKVCTAGGLPGDAPLGWIDESPRVVSPLQLLRGARAQYLWAYWPGMVG